MRHTDVLFQCTPTPLPTTEEARELQTAEDQWIIQDKFAIQNLFFSLFFSFKATNELDRCLESREATVGSVVTLIDNMVEKLTILKRKVRY